MPIIATLYLDSQNVYIDFQMIGKYFSLCYLILVVLGSESPYLAKVSLAPINDQAEIVCNCFS